MTAGNRKPPFDSIFVADFTRVLAGPLCTMMLGDAGARVVKIEERGRGDETRRWGPPFTGGESAYFLALNRNKESITVDLKNEASRDIVRRIISRADVVVENFRPEQKRQFRLTTDAIRQVNPRAVVCSISGFDRETAEETLPGYDLLAQAAGGLMTITGERDGDPTKAGVALSDVLTAHYAYGAIATALYARERDGHGEAIEISLFGATVASLVNVAQSFLVTREEPLRYGNAHPSIVPYQTFHAADRMFALAVGSDRHFGLLCERVIERSDLATDPRYATNADRVTNRASLILALETIFATRSAADWVARCNESAIPAAVVASFEEIFSGTAAHLVATVEHPAVGPLRIVRNPLRLTTRSLEFRSAPPLLGAQTDEVLRELGYSDPEIARLREENVV